VKPVSHILPLALQAYTRDSRAQEAPSCAPGVSQCVFKGGLPTLLPGICKKSVAQLSLEKSKKKVKSTILGLETQNPKNRPCVEQGRSQAAYAVCKE